MKKYGGWQGGKFNGSPMRPINKAATVGMTGYRSSKRDSDQPTGTYHWVNRKAKASKKEPGDAVK